MRGRVFTSRAEADLALLQYIDGFYNPRRIQKRLGYLGPIEYEGKQTGEPQPCARPVGLCELVLGLRDASS
ncbi:IS3 family transposase [Streptomyces sp. NPDC006512]|uniref:IS3 family transposase n=1 Tax=Streptomyces sp. NPDC006512 TaxID=3154307 RepID=UPI0033A91960